MIGIRTPVKKIPTNSQSISPQGAADETGTSSTAPCEKRQSTTKSPTRQAGPSKVNTKLTPTQRVEQKQTGNYLTVTAPRRVSTEPPPSPKTYESRTKEAMACLIKIKRQLVESRNLKREIKTAVQEATERLYHLVKEAELQLKAGNEKEKTGEGNIETGNIVAETSSLHLRNMDANTLMSRIEQHSKLLHESNKQMEELKASIEEQNKRMGNLETPSYAGVTAAGSRNVSSKRTLHSVVVTSKNEEDTGEEVLDRVRKAVDAKEGWIKVERVRKAKNRKIIMGFETKEERDKVKDRLKNQGADLTVEEVKNKDPMLILRDVLSTNTDGDILRALKNQNRDVFHGLGEEENKMVIKYRRKARNPHTGHVVLTASPVVWRRITEKGYVHIDLQRVRAEDQTPLIQCTRCLGYGHSKKFCEETTDMCSHCGGPHLRAECADWMTGLPAACRNCKKANSPHSEHNAFSTACPVRSKWDEIARATVAYC